MNPSRALLAAVCLVAALVHVNTLWNQFPIDDHLIIEENTRVHGLGNLAEALTKPYWPDTPGHVAMYRPVTTGAFAIQYELGDGHPMLFHAGNVLLHTLVTGLVFWLLLLLSTLPWAAFAGAAVFAVHPVHVEAVAGIVGQAEILTAAFALTAALLYLKGERVWWTAAGIAGLYFLAMGAKEMGATLPGLLLLLEAARPERLRSVADVRAAERWSDRLPPGWPVGLAGLVGRVMRRWPVYALAVVALAGYVAARTAVLGTSVGNDPSPFLYGEPVTTRVFTAIRLWPEYMRLLLFPRDLIMDYGPPVIVPERGLSAIVLLSLILGLGALGIAVATWRRERLVSLGILWFPVAVLPVSNLLVGISILLAERTLYLPSVGLSIVVAGVVALLFRERPSWTRPLAVAGLVILALGAWRTWTRNETWYDSNTVLSTLIAEHPESYRAHWIMYDQLRERGRPEEGLQRLRLAAVYAPGHYQILYQLGTALIREQRYEEAVPLLARTHEILKDHPEPYLYHTMALVSLRRFEEAVRVAREAITIHPDHRGLRHFLSIGLTHLGQWEDARDQRIAAIRLADAETAFEEWLHLAELHLRTGHSAEARAALQEARTRAPVPARVPSLASLQSALDPADPAVLVYR